MSRLPVALDGDIVKAQVEPLDGMTVGFSAARVKNRATGYHATTRITLNGQLLAGDLLNFEKHAQRKTLSNDAHAMMPEALRETYGKLFLKRDLDEFCEQIWPVYNQQFQARRVAGDPDTSTEWFCPPLIMKEGKTILFGNKGSGKSMTALAAAISVEHGMSNYWGPIEMATPLYINLERGERSMRRRLGRINRAIGLDPYEDLLMLTALGYSLDNIYDSARAAMKGNDVQVVFLDSLSRTQSGNMNDNEPANAVMDMLSALSDTWVAVAHQTAPEGGKPKVFGSQMYEAAADVVVRLTGDQQGESLGVSMEITKANDTQLGQQKIMAYQFNGTGLEGITNATLKDYPDLDQKALTAADKIELFISNTANVRSTASEISTALGIDPSNVTKTLIRQARRFVKLPKDGKEQPYGLVSNSVERG